MFFEKISKMSSTEKVLKSCSLFEEIRNVFEREKEPTGWDFDKLEELLWYLGVIKNQNNMLSKSLETLRKKIDDHNEDYENFSFQDGIWNIAMMKLMISALPNFFDYLKDENVNKYAILSQMDVKVNALTPQSIFFKEVEKLPEVYEMIIGHELNQDHDIVRLIQTRKNSINTFKDNNMLPIIDPNSEINAQLYQLVKVMINTLKDKINENVSASKALVKNTKLSLHDNL